MKFIKYGAFGLLTLVSAYLSVNMFINLGADFLGKLVLGLVALALESTKVFSLLRIEYTMQLRETNKLVRMPWNSIVIYGFLATLSVVASLGFTLVTVDKQVESSKAVFVTVTADYTFDIEQKQASLALIDSQIQALQSQMKGINPDYATGSVKLSGEAQEVFSAREKLVTEISELKKAQQVAIIETSKSEGNNVYGMFVLMGAIIGITEKQVMTILLVLVSVLIEVSMIYTSPTIIVKSEEAHEVVRAAATILDKPRPSAVEQPPLSRENRNRRATLKVPCKLVYAPLTPHVITKQVRTPIEEKCKTLLQKLLQPAKGTELKPAAVLAYELGIPSEKISELFLKLSKIRSSAGPLLAQKDTAWHLAYMKDLTVSTALKSRTILTLLEGMIDVS